MNDWREDTQTHMHGMFSSRMRNSRPFEKLLLSPSQTRQFPAVGLRTIMHDYPGELSLVKNTDNQRFSYSITSKLLRLPSASIRFMFTGYIISSKSNQN